MNKQWNTVGSSSLRIIVIVVINQNIFIVTTLRRVPNF